MMARVFEIWCEGDPTKEYTACHLGYGKGETLSEACRNLADKNPYFNKVFNFYTMKYSGCRVFDNEEDARASYG
jgi:hypothetical protein